ncbi:MAG: hypothetical protein R3344_12890 [Acidobacteriota bacterium]|nr:hypothetical protein [Acidobacteriota bacterium]
MRRHNPEETVEPFSTVTHARLRLGQGDTAGARRILNTILTRDPGHSEARRLMNEMASGLQKRRPHKDPGGYRDPRGRIARLESWLGRIKNKTGDAHA